MIKYVVGVAVVVSVALTLGTMKHSHSVNRQPHVEVPEDDLAFLAFLTEKYEHSFPVTNASNKTIDLSKFGMSCGCTHVTSSVDQLEPGQTATVRVDIDVVEAGETLTSPVRLRLGVWPRAGWPQWSIEANFVPPLKSVVPAGVSFSDQLRGATDGSTQKVTVECVSSEHQLTVDMDHLTAFTVSQAASTGDGVFDFEVGVKETVSEGFHQEVLMLQVIDRAGNPVASLPYRLEAMVNGEAFVSPSEIHLGVVPSAEVQTRTIRVASRVNREVSVNSQAMRTNAKGFEVVCREVDTTPSDDCLLEVAVTPRKAGRYDEVLMIPVVHDSETATLPLQITWQCITQATGVEDE